MQACHFLQSAKPALLHPVLLFLMESNHLEIAISNAQGRLMADTFLPPTGADLVLSRQGLCDGNHLFHGLPLLYESLAGRKKNFGLLEILLLRSHQLSCHRQFPLSIHCHSHLYIHPQRRKGLFCPEYRLSSACAAPCVLHLLCR